MAPLNFCTINQALVSPRIGIENMDGQAILSGQPKSYARPWTGCITIDQLTEDNLPPFYVRLHDDQVGHLASWVTEQVGHLPSWFEVNRASMTHTKLGQYWPWDFDFHGRISPRRDSWGAEYIDNPEMREQGLGGGKEVPSWTDLGLPLTYTSSHKVMTNEIDAMKTRAAIKRKAEDEVIPRVRMPVKRPRRSSMSVELQKMKEAAEMKRRSTETEKDRYVGGIPELRHAMQIVDAQMRSATEAQNQNAALETMVLTNEDQYIKDMDEMFNEWLAYNQAQRTKAHRLFEVYTAEIKTRGTRIETFEAEVKSSRTLIERQEQKLKNRDAHLAAAKRRWAEQRAFLECKYEAIREIAGDIDEQSRVDFSGSVLDDDGSDYGAEAEEDEEDEEDEDKDEEQAEETGMEEEKDEAEEDEDKDDEEAEKTATEQQAEETAMENDDDEQPEETATEQHHAEETAIENDDNEQSAEIATEQEPTEPSQSQYQSPHNQPPIQLPRTITRRKKTNRLLISFKGAALYDKLIQFRVQELMRRHMDEAVDNERCVLLSPPQGVATNLSETQAKV